jgi:chromosomal replication initiation ATPase DnaA
MLNANIPKDKEKEVHAMLVEFEQRLAEVIGFKLRLSVGEIKPDKMPNPQDVKMSIIHVSNVVAEVFEIEKSDMISKCRLYKFVDARAMCYNIIRSFIPDVSLQTIGKYFDGRDHSTVLYGLELFNERMVTDKTFAERYFKILDQLNIK